MPGGTHAYVNADLAVRDETRDMIGMAVGAVDVPKAGMKNTISIVASFAVSVEGPGKHNTIGMAANAVNVDVLEITSMLMAHAKYAASNNALPELRLPASS